MAGQITGICTIDLDGVRLESLEGATLDIGGWENTAHTGYTFYGHSRKKKPSTVKCKIVHKANTDLIALRDAFNVNITFSTDTGVSFSIAGASISMPPVLTADGGEIELEFTGPEAVQF